MSLTNIPKSWNLQNPTPYELFVYNQKEKIACLSEFYKMMSDRRQTRQQDIRGQNLSRDKRVFQIGDVIKYNVSDSEIGFGEVIDKSKVSEKLYVVRRIDKNAKFTVDLHSKEMQ